MISISGAGGVVKQSGGVGGGRSPHTHEFESEQSGGGGGEGGQDKIQVRFKWISVAWMLLCRPIMIKSSFNPDPIRVDPFHFSAPKKLNLYTWR